MKAGFLCAGLAFAAFANAAQADTYVTSSTGGNVPFSNYQPSLVLTQSIAQSGIYPPHDSGATVPYLGMVHTFAGNFSPFDMYSAAGQLLPINQNQALYSVIGPYYGGDGKSNFALPNLVGKTIIGTGQGNGLPAFSIGQQTGTATVSLTQANLPAHDHSVGSYGNTSVTGGGQPFNNYQPSLAMTYMIAADGIFPLIASGGGHTMVGEVGVFAGGFKPGGWLIADGRTVNISDYSALFSIIGTTYGGDGKTTFALPDLRGRTAVGAGTGSGLDPVQLGEMTGMPVVQLSEAEMAPHNHDVPGLGVTTSTDGGGQAFSTEQPGLGLNYIIALQGYFPPRDGSGEVPFDTPYLGEVIAFAGGFAPKGWAFADGRVLNILQNQALFALLGTQFGGDGRNNFALPDLRGRTILGAGSGFYVGQRLGSETTTLSVANLPAHTHTIEAAVPEPASWAMMLGGFALAGGALRRRRVAVAFR